MTFIVIYVWSYHACMGQSLVEFWKILVICLYSIACRSQYEHLYSCIMQVLELVTGLFLNRFHKILNFLYWSSFAITIRKKNEFDCWKKIQIKKNNYTKSWSLLRFWFFVAQEHYQNVIFLWLNLNIRNKIWIQVKSLTRYNTT